MAAAPVPTPPAPKRKPLVTIEDSTITGLAASPRFVRELPFLAPVANYLKAVGSAACVPCQRRARQAQLQGLVRAARVAIAGLDLAGQERLKAILGAERVRVRYRMNGQKADSEKVL
jgi:hypothetical protein